MKPKPIKSPMQAPPGSPLFLVKLGADLLKVHKDFMSKVDLFIAGQEELREQAKRIQKLPRGDRGATGPQGQKGDPGKDGENGKDGKDGEVPDLMAIVDMVIENLPKKPEMVPPAISDIVVAVKEAIKDMPISEFPAISREIASYRNQLAMREGQPLAGKVYGKNTWARGGGSSSSGDGIAYEIPTGDVDDSNLVFTVANDPVYIIVNGAQYLVGTGTFATYAAGTITLTSPVGVGGFIRSAYVP